jgi:nitrate/nitrite transporter NarK
MYIVLFTKFLCVGLYRTQNYSVCGRMGGFQGASFSVAITNSHSELPVNVGGHSTDMQRTESAHL